MATLLSLRTASLQLANREVGAGVQDEDKFVTNAEVDRWVNMAIKELVGFLTRHGIHWTEVQYDIDAATNVTSGRAYLPTDMWAVLTVHGVTDDNDSWRLSRHGHRFRPSDTSADASSYRVYKITKADSLGESTLGSKTVIELFPVPTSGTYEVRYVPIPATLEDDEDTFDGVLGWEEYIHTWVARRILMKEGSSVVDLDRTLGDMRARVQDEAQAAELSEGLTVSNVRSSRRGLPGDWSTSLRPRGWH